MSWNESGVSCVETDQGYEKSVHLHDQFACDESFHFFIAYTEPEQKHLEISPGTGRLAFAAAGQGTDVFCIEPSAAMGAILREKIRGDAMLPRQRPLDTETATASRTDQAFPHAVMPGIYNPYMALDEKRHSLESAHRHLDSGATLVLDVHTGIIFPRPLNPAGELQKDSLTYHRQVEPAKQRDASVRATPIFEIPYAGQIIDRVEQKSRAACIEPQEVGSSLVATGFETRCQFGDHRHSPRRPASSLLTIQAERMTLP